MRSRRAPGFCAGVGAVVLSVSVLLGGCTGSTPDAPPTESAQSTGPDGCAVAVAAIVDATQRYVDGFGPVDDVEAAPTPLPSASAAPARPSSAAPSTSAAPTDPDAVFQEALTRARVALDSAGCRGAEVVTLLEDGLADVTAQGPVAGAVLRQLRASMTGLAKPEPTTLEVAPGDDLLAAVATLPAGSTLVLAAGTHTLDDVLVLLSPITVRGAGVGSSTLESTAQDFGVLAIADGRVELKDLTLRHLGKAPANVVLAGPSVSLVATGVAISGGVAQEDGTGGAGILMYDPQSRPGGTATTLEVTDAELADNGSAGIVLTGGHVASIVSSTFRGNGQCGLCFLEGSSGSVTQGTFSDNGVGVAATGTARPTVLDSTVTEGQVGVQASDDAVPVLRGVGIRGSSRAALIWSGRAGGLIEDVTCSDVQFGLVVGPDVTPTVRDSACRLAPARS
ncbi:MAG TPA: right-handed parallel beta-helix repeat-containing protein [Ornithinibacter sp.]|nr:right-handed parallel beta-helix repeat-containing protein [Ornithinibacter sp.]